MDNADELAMVFDFDAADLEANRKGLLTARQQARPSKESRSTKRTLRIVGFGFLAFAFLPMILLFASHAALLPWMIGTIWMISWIFLAMLVLRMPAVKTPADTLKTVEGTVATHAPQAGAAQRSSDYYWEIGGVKFVIPDPDKAGILEQGAAYRVHYLERARQILSVEKIAS